MLSNIFCRQFTVYPFAPKKFPKLMWEENIKIRKFTSEIVVVMFKDATGTCRLDSCEEKQPLKKLYDINLRKRISSLTTIPFHLAHRMRLQTTRVREASCGLLVGRFSHLTPTHEQYRSRVKMTAERRHRAASSGDTWTLPFTRYIGIITLQAACQRKSSVPRGVHECCTNHVRL